MTAFGGRRGVKNKVPATSQDAAKLRWAAEGLLDRRTRPQSLLLSEHSRGLKGVAPIQTRLCTRLLSYSGQPRGLSLGTR